ncbi:hypothetical protein D3C76_1372120 [compost metagenome]
MRWLSRALPPAASSSTAVALPSPRVTLPLLSLKALSRCTVPRVSTELVATATPFCCTLCPVRVMSPVLAWIRPLLITVPALLPGLRNVATSLPRVVERGLPLEP